LRHWRAGQAARLDDRRAALLHGGDEYTFHPILVRQEFAHQTAADLGVVEVGYWVPEWLPQMIIFLMSRIGWNSLRATCAIARL